MSLSIRSFFNGNEFVLTILVAIVTAYLCFWNLGSAQLASWDESLYGVNAFEMDKRGEWLNPYYAGEPDQWNVKPPLMVSLIRVSQNLFGFNELGLRMPSATAAFLLTFGFFLIIKRETDTTTAFLTTGMIWGCTGLIGHHAGRSGDTDAVFAALLFFGTISIYQFSKTLRGRHVLSAAFFFGLAFYAKSTAVLLIVPSILLFVWWKIGIRTILSNRYVWLGIALFLAFPIFWIIINSIYGVSFGESDFGGSNSWTNSFFYDTIQRFSGTGHFVGKEKKWDFFLAFLDSRFNLWYIPFILTCIYLLLRFFRILKKGIEAFRQSDPLLQFSLFMAVPFIGVLHISSNVNGWYFIPMLPFLAIITAHGLQRLSSKMKMVPILWLGLVLFTTGRHMWEHQRFNDELKRFYAQVGEAVSETECLAVDKRLEPCHVLYAEWNSPCQEFITEDGLANGQFKSNYLLTNAANVPSFHSIISFKDIQLFEADNP